VEKLQKILHFAMQKHKGQVDKQGIDYIEHPVYLSLQCETLPQKIVALLHDVIEDTDATKEDLIELGLSKEEIDAVLTLTHTKDISYFEYIEKIKTNELARYVKLLDLQHNLSKCQSEETDKFKSLEKRYTKALTILKE
jgi:(p)ppGpp synthase/HD superfamily hydrolase